MKNYLCLFFVFVAGLAHGQSQPDVDKEAQEFRETLTALVRADTTNPPGNEERAVKIIADRLKKAKIPYTIVDFAPGRQDIVARLKGSGEKKPLLLFSHIDVVGTKDQAWSFPSHDVTEKDGYLYGRGVLDDLGMGVVNLETFIALKQNKIPLKRDVILAYTGDEESGGLGMQYLLKNRPELIDPEIAINEGGGIVLDDNGKVKAADLGVAEKIYVDFQIKTTGDTGHSSRPRPNNAIYRLARALDRISKIKDVERLIPATRAYLKAQAALEQPPLKAAMLALANAKGKLPESALKVLRADPLWAPLLHTTCVATMLAGGTKVNALPPEATANVNCRLLPDETAEQVRDRLAKAVADPQVEIKEFGSHSAGPSSPEVGVVPTAINELMAAHYPGTPVIPTIAMGATDSLFLRARGVASYGFDSLAGTDKDDMRAHGIDERIHVASIKPALQMSYELVLKLAQ